MKVFLVLSGLFVAAVAASYYDSHLGEWSAFKAKHRKTYKSKSEDRYRFHVYMNNIDLINKHNDRYANREVSYSLAPNKYTDMLYDEFLSMMTGLKTPQSSQQADTADDTDTAFGDGPAAYIPIAHAQVADRVDWRKEGAVTPIKDQQKCGSCWSFSVTGALEGQHFRKTGKLVSLSEQNLVDCASDDYDNDGCDGGWVDSAFQYIKDNGGIDLECDYPYEAVQSQCRFKPANNGVIVNGFCDLPLGDECALKEAVATRGPIATAFDAAHHDFHFYHQGIYYQPNCSSTDLDHVVLVVGYGTNENGTEYWICKNSWGETWGEKGYFRMARNRGNNCGIATYPSFPFV